MLTKFKQKIQEILATEAKIAQRLGLSPNMISTIGLALAFLSALAYALMRWRPHPFLLLFALIMLLLSGMCDALDGVVARLFCKTTTFGGFLDSLLDRYGDAVTLVGIVLGELCAPFWGLGALVGSLLVSYSRARAEALGVKMESVGFLERAERIIILSIGTVIAIFWLPALNISVILLAVLSHLTVVQRAIYTYKMLMR